MILLTGRIMLFCFQYDVSLEMYNFLRTLYAIGEQYSVEKNGAIKFSLKHFVKIPSVR